MLTRYIKSLGANGTNKTLMRFTVADSLGREILSTCDTINVTLDGKDQDSDNLGLQTGSGRISKDFEK